EAWPGETDMGIYDRDYYRREGPSFLGSITSTGRVCKYLILLNVLFFILQLLTNNPETGHGWFTSFLLLDCNKVLEGQIWRLLSYAFLHGNFWHIFFNMLFLWWFGSDVEGIYGPREFLSFYLVSAVVGAVAFVLAWVGRLQEGFLCLGASGAVTAVMVLFALHYPTR